MKRMKNLLSQKKEKGMTWLAQCELVRLQHSSASRLEQASCGTLLTERVILSRLFAHIVGAKGLICNHQRNADRLEMGLHSIILTQIKDLF